MELYKDKKWLEEQYVGRKKTTYQIADMTGVCRTTISAWLDKHDIDRRGPVNPLRATVSPEWLYQEYHNKGTLVIDIANILGIHYSTVYEWLRHYGIPIRNNSEAQHFSRKNSVVITPYLSEMLIGELLSDGALSLSCGPLSTSYKHTSKHRKYVSWLSHEFSSQGLQQSGNIRLRSDGCWDYQTLNYPELVQLRDRFYPNKGKKIIPPDLILTPTILLHLYLGDGCLACNKKGLPGIRIATCCFDRASHKVLSNELSRIGIQHTVCLGTKASIYIKTGSVQDFLGFAAPCPDAIKDLYGYKFDGTRRGTIAEWRKQNNAYPSDELPRHLEPR